jgi:hypothetical protein
MSAGIFPRLSGGSDLRPSDLTFKDSFSGMGGRSSLGLGRESTGRDSAGFGIGMADSERNSLGLLGEAGVARMSEERLSLGNAELELKERGSDSWVPAGRGSAVVVVGGVQCGGVQCGAVQCCVFCISAPSN